MKCELLTGLKYVIPIFFSIGMAMSDLHVVGLQEPPRNTSYGGGVASLPAQRNKSAKCHLHQTQYIMQLYCCMIEVGTLSNIYMINLLQGLD